MARSRRPPEDEPGTVPRALRKFRVGDWPYASSTFAAHKMWREARHAWCAANGFDVTAPYGAKPGRDWWAFLALCEQGEAGSAGLPPDATTEGREP